MNDLTTRTFENSNLNEATERIYVLQKDVNESLLSIAGVSGEVAKNETYKEDGFKNAQEWLMKTFGYKKSTAYSMVKIGKEYLVVEIDRTLPIYVSIFKNHKTDEDFSLTQLEKLLPLGKERIELLLSTGDLNYSMTVKEIKELVANTKLLDKEETETETEETEPETEETEPETEETEPETKEKEKHCNATIEICNDCIFVNDEKYGFNDLNKVIKYIKETVKNLNK